MSSPLATKQVGVANFRVQIDKYKEMSSVYNKSIRVANSSRVSLHNEMMMQYLSVCKVHSRSTTAAWQRFQILGIH